MGGDMNALRSAFAATTLFVALGYGICGQAQPPAAYPAKPVKIILPFGPGNSLEIPTRLVAEKVSAALGQPFVIEAQPGAAGQIGAQHVAKSPADGYTLLATTDGVITMLPNLQKQLPFDPIRDFMPIAKMVGIPFVLIAHPSVQARTVEELVTLARREPGKLEFSSGGLGSSQQLVMELFMKQTGTKFTHVPYKGAPQAMMDVLSGQIPVAFAGVPITATLIKQGRLRALGTASDARHPLLADVPTLAEQGIPLRFATWGGLFAPSGTSPEIIRTLNRETNKALQSPDVQARMAEFGLEIYGSTPDEFAK